MNLGPQNTNRNVCGHNFSFLFQMSRLGVHKLRPLQSENQLLSGFQYKHKANVLKRADFIS